MGCVIKVFLSFFKFLNFFVVSPKQSDVHRSVFCVWEISKDGFSGFRASCLALMLKEKHIHFLESN